MFYRSIALISFMSFFLSAAPLLSSPVVSTVEKIMLARAVFSWGKQRPSRLMKDVISDFVEKTAWTENQSLAFFEETHSLSDDLFEKSVKNIQKIMLSKPLCTMDNQSMEKWDCRTAISLLKGLSRISSEYLSETVDFILAVDPESAWSISDYRDVLDAIFEIPDDQKKPLFDKVLKAFYPNGVDSSKGKLKFIKFGPRAKFVPIINYFYRVDEEGHRILERLALFCIPFSPHPLESLAGIYDKIRNVSAQARCRAVNVLEKTRHHDHKIGVFLLHRLMLVLQEFQFSRANHMEEIAIALGSRGEHEFVDYLGTLEKIKKYDARRLKIFSQSVLPILSQTAISMRALEALCNGFSQGSHEVLKASAIWIQGMFSDWDILAHSIAVRNALEKLKYSFPERLEKVAMVASKIMRFQFRPDEHSELASVLNCFPTQLMEAYVDLAIEVNANNYISKKENLLQTIEVMKRPDSLNLEGTRFIVQQISGMDLSDVNIGGLSGPAAILNMGRVFRLMPKNQITDFINNLIMRMREDDSQSNASYRKTFLLISAHVESLTRENPESNALDALFRHWQMILRDGNQNDTRRILKVVRRMGLPLTGEFKRNIQLADYSWALEPINNPYILFEKFKMEKWQEIDWSLNTDGESHVPCGNMPLKDCNNNVMGCSFTLSPKGLYDFSRSLQKKIQPCSGISVATFAELLNALEVQTNDPVFAQQWDVGELRPLIVSASKKDSHMQILLSSPMGSVAAAYLTHIINHICHMKDEGQKWNATASLLSTVRGCTPGQEAAIEKIFYHSAYEITMEAEKPAYEDRYRAVYSIVEKALYDYSMSKISEYSAFMRTVCRVPDGGVMTEPSHQIMAVRGLIGDYVGCPYKLKFDPHAGCLHPLIKHNNCQKILEAYYSFIRIDHFVQEMRDYINKELCLPENKNTGLSSQLYEILDEDADLSLCIQYRDEDDTIGEFKGLSEVGVASLLNRVGMLESQDW